MSLLEQCCSVVCTCISVCWPLKPPNSFVIWFPVRPALAAAYMKQRVLYATVARHIQQFSPRWRSASVPCGQCSSCSQRPQRAWSSTRMQRGMDNGEWRMDSDARTRFIVVSTAGFLADGCLISSSSSLFSLADETLLRLYFLLVCTTPVACMVWTRVCGCMEASLTGQVEQERMCKLVLRGASD
jgi:hypothetical protein